jgi:hypothetical protein
MNKSLCCDTHCAENADDLCQRYAKFAYFFVFIVIHV